MFKITFFTEQLRSTDSGRKTAFRNISDKILEQYLEMFEIVSKKHCRLPITKPFREFSEILG